MNTHEIAEYIISRRYMELPADVIEKAKICILDIIGGCLAAYDATSVISTRKLIHSMGCRQRASLIGSNLKTSEICAAWANSVMANALDIDDGSFWEWGHSGHHGAMVVPVSLSLCESQELTGKELIEAVVIGYEIGIRAGYIVSFLNLSINGGIMGIYGTVAAATKLLGMNSDTIKNALCIADSHNPIGGIEILPRKPHNSSTMGMTKEKIGWAVYSGVNAAFMAKEGYSGNVSIFDYPDIDQIPLVNTTEEFEILKVYHKPYACCRLIHAALDGILELKNKNNLDVQNIKKINVMSSSVAIGLNNYLPNSLEEKQFSLPFTIGSVLADGKIGPQQLYSSGNHLQRIYEQAKKVNLKIDPSIEKLGVAGELQAIVEIERKDGAIFEKKVVNPKGSQENPLKKTDIEGKFRYSSIDILGEQRTEEVINCVNNLDELVNVKSLLNAISK